MWKIFLVSGCLYGCGASSYFSAYSVKSTPCSTWLIFFKLRSFSYFSKRKKISKFGDVTTFDVDFTAKIVPKYGSILAKIGILIEQTFDYHHAKFYQNRTILKDDNLLQSSSQKFGLYVYQFSAKSDHFSALFRLWNPQQRSWHPQILKSYFTHWNMKMTWVWKKSTISIMGLILQCKLKNRVWPHAHMGRMRPKIFFTS